MNLKVTIIEDEAATARNLEFLLHEVDSSIDIIAKTGSVAESVAAWPRISESDLIFMDIRLSDGLSFEIFDKVSVTVPVVFATAYDDYALQAFRKNGIAYLLKPFNKEDVAQAVNKFKSMYQKEMSSISDTIHQLAKELRNTQVYRKSFLVHFQERMIPLRSADLQCFYSENEVTKTVTFEGKEYVMDFTLEKLEQMMDPELFFRVNRQYIINRDAIEHVDFYFNNRLLLALKNGKDHKIIVSKAKAPFFKAWLNQ